MVLGAWITAIALWGVPLAGLPADGVRVAAYELDVRFEPAAGTLAGWAVAYIDPAEVAGDELTFYLHGELRVQDVRVGERSVPTNSQRVFYRDDYSLVANAVRVPLAGVDIGEGLTIAYAGPLHPSSARSASDYMRIDADGVYLRAYGYSLWFPVFLPAGADSHTTEFLSVRLDTPADFVSVFTGRRVGTEEKGGRRISEWEASCDLLEAQCTARRFTVLEEGGTFVYALDDERSRSAAAAVLSFAAELDGLCRAALGERSGARQLHVLQMPAFGDIASGNVVGIAEAGWHGFDAREGAQDTLAHELVHAYVTVPVRRSDPLYALAVEGFPSYFHLPVLDRLRGDGFLERTIARTERDYLARRTAGGLPPEVPLTAIAPEAIGLYKDRFLLNDRALLFCDYLRRGMGPAVFDTFVRRLFGSERFDRASFEALVAEHLPGSAADLALWLDGTELPDRFRVER